MIDWDQEFQAALDAERARTERWPNAATVDDAIFMGASAIDHLKDALETLNFEEYKFWQERMREVKQVFARHGIDFKDIWAAYGI